MNKHSVIQAVMKIERPVFTTLEIATLRHGGISSTSQTLSRFAAQGVVKKVTRGIWCLPSHPHFSSLVVVPFLTPKQRVYVSFVSALHLYGIVEQIPQVIYIATTGRGRIIRTDVGTYSFHQLSHHIFGGFDWYGKREDFLIASPEKALIDSLYLSSRKGKRFSFFPELDFDPSFSFKQAENWGNIIQDKRIRGYVLKKLRGIEESVSSIGKSRGGSAI